ncbi:plant UBX domain-containing protein 9-like isoform X1 [Vicia villosa]|uniref:plant UBX domain-containing protein 9-like isoform X1 n=1 Tax=Vicia villosa TaxID=3911 RepID=UPI00273B200D|nr:plant UBX domain-containing protein 9-like isoform X1 [Vicia villosa]
MTTPTPEAVATFMRITGASEFVAVQKLEEYGGNLNEAVNSHFIEGNRLIQEQNPAATATPHYNYSEANNQNNQNRAGSSGITPLLNAARRFRPSLLFDSNYRRELRDVCNGLGSTTLSSSASPRGSPQGEVMGIPSGINSSPVSPYQQGLSYEGAYRSGNSSSHGQGYYRTNDYQHDYPLAQSTASNVRDQDAEEAMIQAAIEASKKESIERSLRNAPNDLPDNGLPRSNFQPEDDDLANVISLSLQTAEQEEAMRELRVKQLSAEGEKTNTSRIRPEWGDISSDELKEALLIETAFFSEVLDHSSQKFSSLPDLQHNSEKHTDPKRLCSSSSTAQLLSETQLLRKQQDDDYLASLLVDRQKELNSLKKAETHSSKEEESHKKMPERTEMEKILDTKSIMLANEPPLGDEKAITIVVRMPDGGRCERRFFKTDKLQLLFDFIDIYGAVKPGTYRVVKSYPRRAYSINDSSATLNEVGLNNKNEALFLELI